MSEQPVHEPDDTTENDSLDNEGIDNEGAPEDAVDTDEVATATEPVDIPEDTDDAEDAEDADETGNSEDVDEAGDEDEDDEDSSADDADRPSRRARLEQEGEIAADYLEELLEIADLDGDLDMDVEGDRATVSIVGANLPQLVGDQGEVLEALQELTRLAVYRETGERSRLMLDVSGHRADRRTALEKQAAEVVAQVKESGEQASLEPMSPFERKVVHDVVAASGLKSESEGAEPRRYVVVLPA
jgi:spoIIIJ-associated protein